MKQLRLGPKDFEVDEGLNFVSFREAPNASQPANALNPMNWEIFYPNLLGTGYAKTYPIAVLDARRGQSRLSQIMVAWDNQMSTYQITFTVGNDYASICFLDLQTQVIPVVIETPTKTYSFTLDQVTNAITGESPQTLASILDPIRRDFQTLREPLEAWIVDLNSEGQPTPPVMAKESKGDAKQKCDSDRKTGWIKAVGTAILGGIGAMAIPGVGLALATAAVAGAIGGAEAAETENNHKDCTKKAEEKPPA